MYSTLCRPPTGAVPTPWSIGGKRGLIYAIRSLLKRNWTVVSITAAMNDKALPHLLGRRDVLLFQFLLDLPQGTAAEVSLIDTPDNIRLLRHDLRLTVRTVTVV